MANFFEQSIEYLKGVGPEKSALLNKELSIFTFGDFIQHYPFRYEDRTKYYQIAELREEMPNVQVKGQLKSLRMAGTGRKKRLVGRFVDETGELELVWFQRASWLVDKLQAGAYYTIFGKPNRFGSKLSIAHPEIDITKTQADPESGYLNPVYSTTERLKNKYLDSKALARLQKTLLHKAIPYIQETLPDYLIDEFSLIAKKEALVHLHFPENHQWLEKAKFRMKFEELFYVQLKLLKQKVTRQEKYKGLLLNDTSLLNQFYKEYLPFELTDAQKRVIKEIYRDMKSSQQMNRLLQGDVGSGKTIVSFICMLIAISSQSQTALMAPTEILADQHFQNLYEMAKKLGLRVAKLTGSTKKKERKIILDLLAAGEIHILIGTHALLEDRVRFKQLGLAVIDEQHRFGVAQRAKLWQKNADVYPHVLVMTATPIPRTLAMTLYGDLDVSIIDELPKGRKPIKTLHRYDSSRLKVFSFLKEEIEKGRQVYIVYPLIEESETLDYKDLMDGYESIVKAFPQYPISILHGKMTPEAKDIEMGRFVKNETKIMVSTTVIEVGVNVPNASVMVVENAERFGLSQLHQLRGRVGRGAEQSYCILMTDFKLTKEAKIRLETLVRSTDGFEIADVDLKLRGPGDLMGTQQSGVLDLIVADLSKDGKILQAARNAAIDVLDRDPDLNHPANNNLRKHIESLSKNVVNWGRIS